MLHKWHHRREGGRYSLVSKVGLVAWKSVNTVGVIDLDWIAQANNVFELKKLTGSTVRGSEIYTKYLDGRHIIDIVSCYFANPRQRVECVCLPCDRCGGEHITTISSVPDGRYARDIIGVATTDSVVT